VRRGPESQRSDPVCHFELIELFPFNRGFNRSPAQSKDLTGTLPGVLASEFTGGRASVPPRRGSEGRTPVRHPRQKEQRRSPPVPSPDALTFGP
jgi:hypothetical protein